MKYFWAIFLGLFLVMCPMDRCDSPTLPDLPGETQPPAEEDPYVRNDTRPDLRQVVGVSAFALALRDENYVRYYIDRVQEHGYSSIRVLSKTDGWADNHTATLPPGPPMGGGAEKNLKRLLRAAAEYPNFWVELVACATERDDHQECKQWTHKVATIAKEYKNVYLSAMNEPQMSNWTTGELNELIGILRKSAPRHMVGIDQPAEGGSWKFNPSLNVDFRAVHPRRNPDLSLAEIQNVVRLNGLTLFDETTCYCSDSDVARWPRMKNNSLYYLNGTGTEKQRRNAAKKYMESFKKVRSARWFFHSVATIACDRLDFWLPRWR